MDTMYSFNQPYHSEDIMEVITIPIKTGLDACTLLELAQEIAEELVNRIEGGHNQPATVDLQEVTIESK